MKKKYILIVTILVLFTISVIQVRNYRRTEFDFAKGLGESATVISHEADTVTYRILGDRALVSTTIVNKLSAAGWTTVHESSGSLSFYRGEGEFCFYEPDRNAARYSSFTFSYKKGAFGLLSKLQSKFFR